MSNDDLFEIGDLSVVKVCTTVFPHYLWKRQVLMIEGGPDYGADPKNWPAEVRLGSAPGPGTMQYKILKAGVGTGPKNPGPPPGPGLRTRAGGARSRGGEGAGGHNGP